MAGEADRLEQAANALKIAAEHLDKSSRNLYNKVKAQVAEGEYGWKGPHADKFWWATEQRANRLWRTHDRMADLVSRMCQQAAVVRMEQARRR